MTEKERFRAAELKQDIINERRKCEVCGKRVGYNTAQLAHRIPQHKKYIKKYGRDFIHSRKNMALVCSLECNAAVLCDPATHPVEASELFNEWLDLYR
jgi:hypothetical protein